MRAELGVLMGCSAPKMILNVSAVDLLEHQYQYTLARKQ
jgi:hypothetical protein